MANDLDPEKFFRLMDDEALFRRSISVMSQQPDGLLPDQLRVAGHYASLRDRAKAKEEKLLRLGLEEADVAKVNLDRGQLFDWYFRECLSTDKPRHMGVYARALRYDGEDGFLRTVLREFLFRER
jgi:hypothetical protein